jgi:hypothetical protein
VFFHDHADRFPKPERRKRDKYRKATECVILEKASSVLLFERYPIGIVACRPVAK